MSDSTQKQDSKKEESKKLAPVDQGDSAEEQCTEEEIEETSDGKEPNDKETKETKETKEPDDKGSDDKKSDDKGSDDEKSGDEESEDDWDDEYPGKIDGVPGFPDCWNCHHQLKRMPPCACSKINCQMPN